MDVSFRKEFQCGNFCFHYTKPYKFIRPQWRISMAVYVVWRLFWAFWHIGWITFSIQKTKIEALYEGAGIKWLIYLTDLSYLVQTLQSCLHFGVIFYDYAVQKDGAVEESIQWYLKLLWFLTTLGFDVAIVVTVLYWTLEFDGKIKTVLTIATHAINSVYVLIDIFVITAPVRLLHLIYPVMFGVAYVTFTIVYHMYNDTEAFGYMVLAHNVKEWSALDGYCGQNHTNCLYFPEHVVTSKSCQPECQGTNSKSQPYIYKSLDWSKPVPSAVISLGSTFVAMPAIHLLQFGLYWLRLYLLETSECCGKCAYLDQDVCSRDREGEHARDGAMTEDARNRGVPTIV